MVSIALLVLLLLITSYNPDISSPSFRTEEDEMGNVCEILVACT